MVHGDVDKTLAAQETHKPFGGVNHQVARSFKAELSDPKIDLLNWKRNSFYTTFDPPSSDPSLILPMLLRALHGLHVNCGRGQYDCLLTMAEVEWEHEQYFRWKVLSHRLGRRLPTRPEPPPKSSIRSAFKTPGKIAAACER
jgi:hypothetical protein